MSRLESGFIQPKKDWCDINELVSDTVHRLEDQLQHHKVVIAMENDMPLFKLDYGLMEQVLRSNACCITPALYYTLPAGSEQW